MNLNDLYKKVSVIPIGDFPPSALSGLLHGYISIYSIVRVNPWLEDVYGSQWDIHERIREIAGELADTRSIYCIGRSSWTYCRLDGNLFDLFRHGFPGYSFRCSLWDNITGG